MSFVNVMRLQKRQKAPTNTKSNEGFLAPFPTVPPILETGKINNNPPLDNTVTESNDDGGNEIEIFGLIGGALVVIILIGIFIKKKLIGDSKKSDRNAYRSSSSQNLIDDLNEQGKNSPIMIEQNSTQFVTSSPRTYDPPHSDSNDPRLGPSSVNKNLYSLQNKNPNSKQDLSHSPDSYRGPSLDDDSIHLSHSPFNPNFQQKDPSYPSDPYKRSSRDGYSSPYLPQSSFPPNTPNTPNTPHTPPYPPNAYGQDDYPSPYLSPFTPNTPNTPNTPLYPPNTYGVPSQDDYPSPYLPKSLFTPNTPNTPSYPPNSYVGSQNNQSCRNSQHFQQQYPLDPTQGTLLSSYQPQQYRSSPNSPHSLEDPPRSPLFSKIEPVPTNDQNSMSYQDTPLDPTIGNNINSDDANENLSINSDITNNELKELNDMIANIIHSENVHSSLPNHISDSSFAGLLSDIPKTSTNEKSNRPVSQASSIYSVQPNQGMGQIEMASKNKIPSSNLNHDHDLPQSAAIGYIEPMQSNMVIERVNEPSGTSEVQLNMTQPITTGFIQPSQSSMKIEKVDGDTTFRPEISAPIMTRVENQASPKPMYDIVGIKKHAEMILNAKAEKKFDLNNESNSEKVTKNNETQNDENVIEKNDGNQGEPLVRKKSVRFRSESNANQEEEIKVSKPKKSILINKKDAINVQSSALKSENGYDSGDDKANNRDSKLNSYYFDISGYQEDTHLANEEQS